MVFSFWSSMNQTLPFFFSFLKGVLDVAVAGEVGGLLEAGAAEGEGTLSSAGAGALLSTSVDMVGGQPHGTGRRTPRGGGVGGKPDSSSTFRRAAQQRHSALTHTLLVMGLQQGQRSERFWCVREKDDKMEDYSIPFVLLEI